MIYWLIGYKTSYPNGADNKEENKSTFDRFIV
jgi:hypothetical protein